MKNLLKKIQQSVWQAIGTTAISLLNSAGDESTWWRIHLVHGDQIRSLRYRVVRIFGGRIALYPTGNFFGREASLIRDPLQSFVDQIETVLESLPPNMGQIIFRHTEACEEIFNRFSVRAYMHQDGTVNLRTDESIYSQLSRVLTACLECGKSIDMRIQTKSLHPVIDDPRPKEVELPIFMVTQNGQPAEIKHVPFSLN